MTPKVTGSPVLTSNSRVASERDSAAAVPRLTPRGRVATPFATCQE